MKTAFVILGHALTSEMLATGLRQAGIYPVVAASFDDARRLAQEFDPDLLLIDVDNSDAACFLDDLSAIDRCARTPWVLITSGDGNRAPTREGSVSERVWISKPVNLRELLVLVIRLLRRSNARFVDVRWSGLLRRGPVELDLDRFTMTVDVAGATVPFGLGPSVTRVMARLMERTGSVCGRDELLAQVWPDDFTVTLRTVDQNVRRIRTALRSVGLEDAIRTVQGEGYSFVIPADLDDRSGDASTGKPSGPYTTAARERGL